MSRGPLEWLGALREQAERRAAGRLRSSQARLAEAGRLAAEAPGAAGTPGELALAWRRASWAAGERERRAGEVAEARARALQARAAAGALRALLEARRAAAREARERRAELEAAEAWGARAREARRGGR